MKLTLAASALASALPLLQLCGVAQGKQEFTVPLEGRFLEAQSHQRQKMQAWKEKLRKQHGSQRQLKKQDHVPLWQQFRNVVQECDPTVSEADVGILGCGLDEYCIESLHTHLGGVCVPKNPQSLTEKDLKVSASAGRRLEQNGNGPNEPYPFADDDDEVESEYNLARELCSPYSTYSYGCDCTNFDLFTGVGNFTCKLEELYCYSYCPVETCFTYRLEYTNPSGDVGEVTFCTDFVTPVAYPFCITYRYTAGAANSYTGPCEVQIGDDYCTDCFSQDDYCIAFDCEEFGAGSNECDGTYGSDIYPEPELKSNCTAPTYAPYTLAPTVSLTGDCDVCPEGTSFPSDTNITTVFFPNIGGIYCQTIEALTTQGLIYGPACDYVTSVAQPTCCE